MSSCYKEDWRVRCPFYCKESHTDIKCSGIVGTHTISVFQNKQAKTEYKYDFCNGIYTACPIWQDIDANIILPDQTETRRLCYT